MIKVQEKALESMREGVFDVLPEGSLDGLTAEDLRLLLNGVGDINVSVLISYTSFNDESGESTDRLVKFKRWLWSIVEKMSHIERQDLVIIFSFFLSFLNEFWNSKHLYFGFLGIFLDWFACVASERGRFSANAQRDNSSGRRCSLAHGQHLHIASLCALVQLAPRAAAQVTSRHKNQKLWLRLNSRLSCCHHHRSSSLLGGGTCKEKTLDIFVKSF